MQRDRRSSDNWALIYAQSVALEKKVPLIVLYSLNGNFPDSNIRQYGFMLKGLRETIESLRKKDIPVYVVRGDAVQSVLKFINQEEAGLIEHQQYQDRFQSQFILSMHTI